MSKFYQKIQKIYKFRIKKKIYSKRLLFNLYFKKYLICLNQTELGLNKLKEIQRYANFIELPQNTIYKNCKIQNFSLNQLNGFIKIYATNNIKLFFLILRKINSWYHFICYEKHIFFSQDSKNNFINLYELYQNNFHEFYYFIFNLIFLNINILIFFIIFKISVKI